MTTKVAARETPLFFEGGDETLFGVLTEPVEGNGIAVILLAAGRWIPSTSRNRLWVRIARSLVDQGYSTFRFDYRGVGESTGSLDRYEVEGGPLLQDVDGAVACLRARGIDRFVFVGWCFGARLALMRTDIPGLQGIVHLALPIVDYQTAGEKLKLTDYASKALNRDVLRRLFNKHHRHIYMRLVRGLIDRLFKRLTRLLLFRKPLADDWVGPLFLKDFSASVEQKVPQVIVYGDEDGFYDEFVRASPLRLGKLLADGEAHLKTEVIKGELHKLLSVDNQDVVVERLPEWLAWVGDMGREERVGHDRQIAQLHN